MPKSIFTKGVQTITTILYGIAGTFVSGGWCGTRSCTSTDGENWSQDRQNHSLPFILSCVTGECPKYGLCHTETEGVAPLGAHEASLESSVATLHNQCAQFGVVKLPGNEFLQSGQPLQACYPCDVCEETQMAYWLLIRHPSSRHTRHNPTNRGIYRYLSLSLCPVPIPGVHKTMGRMRFLGLPELRWPEHWNSGKIAQLERSIPGGLCSYWGIDSEFERRLFHANVRYTVSGLVSLRFSQDYCWGRLECTLWTGNCRDLAWQICTRDTVFSTLELNAGPPVDSRTVSHRLLFAYQVQGNMAESTIEVDLRVGLLCVGFPSEILEEPTHLCNPLLRSLRETGTNCGAIQRYFLPREKRSSASESSQPAGHAGANDSSRGNENTDLSTSGGEVDVYEHFHRAQRSLETTTKALDRSSRNDSWQSEASLRLSYHRGHETRSQEGHRSGKPCVGTCADGQERRSTGICQEPLQGGENQTPSCRATIQDQGGDSIGREIRTNGKESRHGCLLQRHETTGSVLECYRGNVSARVSATAGGRSLPGHWWFSEFSGILSTRRCPSLLQRDSQFGDSFGENVTRISTCYTNERRGFRAAFIDERLCGWLRRSYGRPLEVLYRSGLERKIVPCPHRCMATATGGMDHSGRQLGCWCGVCTVETEGRCQRPGQVQRDSSTEHSLEMASQNPCVPGVEMGRGSACPGRLSMGLQTQQTDSRPDPDGTIVHGRGEVGRRDRKSGSRSCLPFGFRHSKSISELLQGNCSRDLAQIGLSSQSVQLTQRLACHHKVHFSNGTWGQSTVHSSKGFSRGVPLLTGLLQFGTQCGLVAATKGTKSHHRSGVQTQSGFRTTSPSESASDDIRGFELLIKRLDRHQQDSEINGFCGRYKCCDPSLQRCRDRTEGHCSLQTAWGESSPRQNGEGSIRLYDPNSSGILRTRSHSRRLGVTGWHMFVRHGTENQSSQTRLEEALPSDATLELIFAQQGHGAQVYGGGVSAFQLRGSTGHGHRLRSHEEVSQPLHTWYHMEPKERWYKDDGGGVHHDRPTSQSGPGGHRGHRLQTPMRVLGTLGSVHGQIGTPFPGSQHCRICLHRQKHTSWAVLENCEDGNGTLSGRRGRMAETMDDNCQQQNTVEKPRAQSLEGTVRQEKCRHLGAASLEGKVGPDYFGGTCSSEPGWWQGATMSEMPRLVQTDWAGTSLETLHREFCRLSTRSQQGVRQEMHLLPTVFRIWIYRQAHGSLSYEPKDDEEGEGTEQDRPTSIGSHLRSGGLAASTFFSHSTCRDVRGESALSSQEPVSVLQHYTQGYKFELQSVFLQSSSVQTLAGKCVAQTSQNNYRGRTAFVEIPVQLLRSHVQINDGLCETQGMLQSSSYSRESSSSPCSLRLMQLVHNRLHSSRFARGSVGCNGGGSGSASCSQGSEQGLEDTGIDSSTGHGHSDISNNGSKLSPRQRRHSHSVDEIGHDSRQPHLDAHGPCHVEHSGFQRGSENGDFGYQGHVEELRSEQEGEKAGESIRGRRHGGRQHSGSGSRSTPATSTGQPALCDLRSSCRATIKEVGLLKCRGRSYERGSQTHARSTRRIHFPSPAVSRPAGSGKTLAVATHDCRNSDTGICPVLAHVGALTLTSSNGPDQDLRVKREGGQHHEDTENRTSRTQKGNQHGEYGIIKEHRTGIFFCGSLSGPGCFGRRSADHAVDTRVPGALTSCTRSAEKEWKRKRARGIDNQEEEEELKRSYGDDTYLETPRDRLRSSRGRGESRHHGGPSFCGGYARLRPPLLRIHQLDPRGHQQAISCYCSCAICI